MVDLNFPAKKVVGDNAVGYGVAGEGSKLKTFMGKTPGILKSKLLNVLGNSNELLNGISNKLILSSSSSDDCCDDDEEVPVYDETIDYTKIDFESRRLKSRRAHEEVISGKFRHPNLRSKSRQNNPELDITKALSSSNGSSSSEGGDNSIDSKKSTPTIDEVNNKTTELGDDLNRVNGVVSISPTIELNNGGEDIGDNNDPDSGNVLELTARDMCEGSLMPQSAQHKTTSNSSTLTSLNDAVALAVSPSLESSDFKNWIRSESQNSVASWASSISLDSQTEENVKDFMKRFVEILFLNSPNINLKLKAEFGEMAQLEAGRLWFSRFVQSHRIKSKKVGESTFFSLIQYFSIILLECMECEDYYPAKHLMNMCFTFYHEIEVPGCEPYREYLFTYLRQQPIWHTLRFWNAAFFDALQCQRANHSMTKTGTNNRKPKTTKTTNKKSVTEILNADDSSSDSSHNSFGGGEDLKNEEDNDENDQKNQQTLIFKLLGTFTFNMHAFGMNRELCLEFLKKQSTLGNITKDQENMLRDNISRMYHETDLWGSKET